MTLASETTFSGTSSGIGSLTFSGAGSTVTAKNGGGTAIELTGHTHTQGNDSAGHSQAITDAPNA